MKSVNRTLFVCALATLAAGATHAANKVETHVTAGFKGPKANTGMAEHYYQNGKSMLRVTGDFKVPDTPAPTWRVVDSKGNIYTLDAFKIKGGEKRQIVVPAYVKDIARVEVYCAWAEVLLGDAAFSQPVR